ncbi:MAG: glycosyltransferase [Clostridia bacterium]|nr:glycosyltransferase [Clostridia bacterium]
MEKKLISIVVPVFNEQDNLPDVYRRVTAVMQSLPAYDYELVFFDDGSTDGSRACISALCERDTHVKAVLYARNFGYSKTIFYAVQQAKGDCAILLHADLQNPPELIPQFVESWENGAGIVQGVKTKSKESVILFFLRSVYYWLMNVVFGVKLIPHATEFQLFDVSFIRVLQRVRDNHPFLRGLVLEYGHDLSCITYTQEKRERGKTKFNLNKYYDFAINGVISASDRLPRRMIVFSFVMLVLLFIETVCFFVFFSKALTGSSIMNALVLRVLLASVLIGLVFLAVLFEYVIGVSKNAAEKPLIVEEARIRY